MKRYKEITTQYLGGHSSTMIIEDPRGEWVQFDDHLASIAALHDRIATLERETAEAMEVVREANAVTERAAGKFAALVAENGALLDQSEQVYSAGYRHGHLNTVDGIAYKDDVAGEFYGRAIEIMHEPPTPSTDACVAEFQAQGVDMVINYHMERSEALKEVDRIAAFNHSNAALDASAVADKLRGEQGK